MGNESHRDKKKKILFHSKQKALAVNMVQQVGCVAGLKQRF